MALAPGIVWFTLAGSLAENTLTLLKFMQD
jgi:hypothetical protein